MVATDKGHNQALRSTLTTNAKNSPESKNSRTRVIETSNRLLMESPGGPCKKRVDTTSARIAESVLHAPNKSETAASELPSIIASAGPSAQFAWEEFLYGTIRNPHTRRSYERATRRFLAWTEARGRQLQQITPADVGRYLEDLSDSPASKKVYLASIRHLFDLLVQRHVGRFSTQRRQRPR